MTEDLLKANRDGRCLICNDVLYKHDSKYLALDGTMICTIHKVSQWQAKGIDFAKYKFLNGELIS